MRQLGSDSRADLADVKEPQTDRLLRSVPCGSRRQSRDRRAQREFTPRQISAQTWDELFENHSFSRCEQAAFQGSIHPAGAPAMLAEDDTMQPFGFGEKRSVSAGVSKCSGVSSSLHAGGNPRPPPRSG